MCKKSKQSVGLSQWDWYTKRHKYFKEMAKNIHKQR